MEKSKCNIKDATELFCYELVLKYDYGDNPDKVSAFETVYVVAPNLLDACKWAYEYSSEIVSAKFRGRGAIGSI